MNMNIDEAQWNMAKQQMAQADPEQMLAQARMMKNMDKNALRSMNPQFAGMSDADIDMAASQMEMMASNPAMLIGYSPAADGAPVDLNALKDAAVDAAAAVTNAEDDEFA